MKGSARLNAHSRSSRPRYLFGLRYNLVPRCFFGFVPQGSFITQGIWFSCLILKSEPHTLFLCLEPDFPWVWLLFWICLICWSIFQFLYSGRQTSFSDQPAHYTSLFLRPRSHFQRPVLYSSRELYPRRAASVESESAFSHSLINLIIQSVAKYNLPRISCAHQTQVYWRSIQLCPCFSVLSTSRQSNYVPVANSHARIST